MNIQSVINRALKDEKFAAQLRDQAMAAAQDSGEGQEWETFAANFAESPEELARLGKVTRRLPRASAAERELLIENDLEWAPTGTTTTTTTTITTTTTPACTITTTTTTTTTLTTLTTATAVVAK